MESMTTTAQNMNMSAQVANIMSIMSEFVKDVYARSAKKTKDADSDAMDLVNKVLPQLISIARTESFASDSGVKRAPGRPKGVKAEPGVKRARTAYILFCADERPKLQGTKKNGKELTGKEITAILGDMWKVADGKVKDKYNQLALKDKERYTKEMKDAPPSEKPFYTPFNYFKKINKDKVAKEEGLSGKELNTRLSELWKSLSRKDKSDYKTKSILYKPSEEEKSSKSKAPKAKAPKAPSKPAKYSGYIVFCLFHRQGIKEEYDQKLAIAKKNLASATTSALKEKYEADVEFYTRSATQITEELGSLWNGISDAEKKEFNKIADKYTKVAKKEFDDMKKAESDDDESDSESESESDDDESESESDESESDESESDDESDDESESESEEEEEKPKKRVLPSIFGKASNAKRTIPFKKN